MDIGKTAYPKFLKSSPYAATRCSATTTALSSLPNPQPNVPTLSQEASTISSLPGTKTPPANLSSRRESCSRHMDLQKAARPIQSAPRRAISKLFENSSSSSPSRGGPQPGSKSKLTLKQVNEHINALLEQNIVHSDGVINLFKVEDETVSVFDPKFLASLSRMKERNLAYELLKKLIDDQIRGYRSKERHSG